MLALYFQDFGSANSSIALQTTVLNAKDKHSTYHSTKNTRLSSKLSFLHLFSLGSKSLLFILFLNSHVTLKVVYSEAGLGYPNNKIPTN